MKDTGYVKPEQRRGRCECTRASPTARSSDQPLDPAVKRRVLGGGGGLYSTARDYMVFLQMLMNGGSSTAGGPQPKTVALMNQNQIGNIPAACSRPRCLPARTTSISSPASDVRWGLAT